MSEKSFLENQGGNEVFVHSSFEVNPPPKLIDDIAKFFNVSNEEASDYLIAERRKIKEKLDSVNKRPQAEA